MNEEPWFLHSAESTVLPIPYPSLCAFYKKLDSQYSDKEKTAQASIRKIARSPKDSACQSL